MTRKEAITNLNMISVAFVEPVTKGQRELIDDTINMAIKALEQEPCEDAISRKEVLNQIFYSTDNSGDVVLGSVLRHRIENLPSVKPQEPILDKIRAEIEELKPNNPNFKGYFDQNVALNKALDIIDKYRGESDCRECKVEHDCYECKKYTESEEKNNVRNKNKER